MKDNMEGQTFSAWSYLTDMDCQFGTLGFKASMVFQNGLRIQHDSYVDVLHEYKTEEKEKNPRKLSWKYLHVLMAVIALILCNVLFVIMRETSDDQGTYDLPWRHKENITDMKVQTQIILFTTACFIRKQSHTTIYIRMNQYPNEIGAASARSQILRKFRRFTQTMLLELIYKSSNQNMPMNPYKHSPPGWSEYKPDIEFGNISNLRSGEEKIFNKMVFLLQNKSQIPLPSEWKVLLEHYNDLNEKREQKESKKALEIWMLQTKLIPLLQEYSKEVDVPSEEIMKHCFAIFLKSTYVDQFIDYSESNKWDSNAKQQCKVQHAEEELSNDEMLSSKTSQNKESLEPEAKMSECTIALNHQYGENESLEIPNSLQNMELCQKQSKEQSNGDKLNCMENIDYESSDDQWIQTHPEEIDLSTFSSETPFLSSDCDPLQQISSKDNLGIDPVSSEVNPSLENMDTSCDDNQDKISNFDTLSEKDYDELAIDIFEPDSLQKYLKELENNHPSTRMVTLCNDILKKDHGHIDSHKDFF